jgi:hypothetical protein
MRVIRTTIYFNDIELEQESLSFDHNVEFAWFNTGNTNIAKLSFVNSLVDEARSHVPRFLDIVIQGSELRNFIERIHNVRIANPGLVQEILEAGVVIERSPPESVTFASLLRGASSVTIGTLLGDGVAGGSYPLMFVTIPFGIIVIGSAIGISKGLQDGLQREVARSVKRMFK